MAPTPPPPNKCPLNACSLELSLELPFTNRSQYIAIKFGERLLFVGKQ